MSTAPIKSKKLIQTQKKVLNIYFELKRHFGYEKELNYVFQKRISFPQISQKVTGGMMSTHSFADTLSCVWIWVDCNELFWDQTSVNKASLTPTHFLAMLFSKI